ncbi:MAG: hypothetical protein VX323_09055 [Pseudomonadota bacterium]|nr:hypothetical protein [Pseudomonadota bacterium]
MALQDLTDEAFLALAEPMMDNCLAGSNVLNREQHVRDFTERMKAIVTPENLRRQLTPRRHGVFTTRTVVGVFRQRAGVGVVWLQRCSASDDELVNHAIFVDTPEGPKIDHCLIC